MHINTTLAQAGTGLDPATGAVSMPVYQCATFAHPALGQSTGYDYSRTANPTRAALEKVMATLDGGAGACAFSSGLAAIDAVLRLFSYGDKILVTEDMYGGTVRLFEQFHGKNSLEAVFVDTTDTASVRTLLATGEFKAIFVEIPTNPLLKVAELSALCQLARENGALVIVDNTFLTPYFLQPMKYGADITVYSATKYLGGHNDVVAGVAVAATEELSERLHHIQNSTGAILGPQDSWLLLRGLKTLGLRLKAQEKSAMDVALFLASHPAVRVVYYPGLAGTRDYNILSAIASGYGSVVSFELDPSQEGRVAEILSRVKVFSFAESLGGVESLITFPATQTHADIDEQTRCKLGINDRLLRLSVGAEDIRDILDDLASVLES